MGNRGALHNDSRELVRPFKLQRWISCLLEFKRRRRSVMAPGRYTELFFLDEAVAFAAGHRPCAECRRQRFNAFKEAWLRRGVPRRTEPLRAPEIDAELHHARLDNSGGKVTYQSALAALPNGCFVEIDGDAYLVWSNALVLWTAAGYASEIPRPGRLTVTVLTPRPIVECFRCGYVPETSRNDA